MKAANRPDAERLLAAALCLPAALLVLPGASPLAGDPAPELSGSAWLLLAALPAALVALLARPARAPLVLAPWLVLLALALGWLRFGHDLDTLELDRALFGLVAGAALLVGGARLGPAGARALALGLCAIAGLALAGALLDVSGPGPLGNAGDVAHAALPGAAAGALLATTRVAARGARALGLATALAFVAFALATPSLLAALALGAALLAGALGRDATPRARLARAGAGALVIALVPFAARGPSGAATPDDARGAGAAADAQATAAAPFTGPASDPGDTGGGAVRVLVWRATLAMIAERPALGVGPGQFARAFPPYRDPAEIERSTLGRRLAAETEVEHPHCDLLAVAAELGLAGAAAFALLVALVVGGAVRALRAGQDDGRPALAGAALAALAVGLGSGALLDDPALACTALAAFGALGARPSEPGASAGRAGRLLPLATLVALLALAPDAWAVARHGRALSAATRALAVEPARPAREPARFARAIDRALALRADSALALGLRARLLEAERPADDERVLAAWNALLALRPWRVEALMQAGNAHARRGDERAARELYRRALELDPEHPGLGWNLARLELLDGRVAPGLAALEPARARLDPARARGLVAELLLRGLDREGLALADALAVVPAGASAEELWSASQALRAGGDERLADALESQAQRAWARRHAEAGRCHDAVRSYRQALRATYALDPDGALRVRLELAAAALCDGDEALARERVHGARPSAADWAGLPAWAGERLLATGWFAE